MSTYLTLLPHELNKILHRYVYGPVFIKVTRTKYFDTPRKILNFSFYTDGARSTTIEISINKESLGHVLSRGYQLEEFDGMSLRQWDDNLEIQSNSANITLDATTTQLVRTKLQRIADDWDLDVKGMY